MAISKINEIIQAANGEVRLSGWDGEPFVCRLRRPGLVEMAASGNVPNPLLGVIRNMLLPNIKAISALPDAESAAAMLEIVRAAMVEPTYEELKKAGVQLTDDQISEIYAYAVGGALGLSRFHQALRRRADEHGADVPVQSGQFDGDTGSL